MLAGAAVFIFLFAPSLSAPQEAAQGKEADPLPSNEIGNLDAIEDYLGAMLESWESPLVWVSEEEEAAAAAGVGGGEEGRMEVPWKRARYYRRYPWKRQNGRQYNPDGYLCAPSRDDVFQLLMALHEARNGNPDRTVSFCNRRRPARAVFTNIRFLGRR